MYVTTEKQEYATEVDKHRRQLIDMQNGHHEACHVCGLMNPSGLHAKFQVCDDGAVETSFICDKTKEGYEGLVHGGVIASLLDGAMTNYLFSYGIAAVTGEMTIRMLYPVLVQVPVVVRAWLEKSRAPLYFLRAELSQNGYVSARAEGKFFNKTFKRRNCGGIDGRHHRSSSLS
jgi:acyl-coenzyme A thioesterase PaaI-like protein